MSTRILPPQSTFLLTQLNYADKKSTKTYQYYFAFATYAIHIGSLRQLQQILTYLII